MTESFIRSFFSMFGNIMYDIIIAEVGYIQISDSNCCGKEAVLWISEKKYDLHK